MAALGVTAPSPPPPPPLPLPTPPARPVAGADAAGRGNGEDGVHTLTIPFDDPRLAACHCTAQRLTARLTN